MPPTQTGGCRAARLEQTWTSQANVRSSSELIEFTNPNKLIKLIKSIRFKYCLCEEAKTLYCKAARLQAAGSRLQGCRLQGCRQQVAHCKAAGSRLCTARLQAAGCKAAGRKAARQKCCTWLLAAANIAYCTSCTAAFGKRRKRCTVAIGTPKSLHVPHASCTAAFCEEANTLYCCNVAPQNRYTSHVPALATCKT